MTLSKSRQCADSVCAAFRKSLLSGQTPLIEDYLGSVDGLYRTRLFVELLEMELAARRHFPDTCAEEYVERFPEFAVLVEAAIHKYAPTMIGTCDDIHPMVQPADFSLCCPLFSAVPQEILHQRTTKESFTAGEYLMRQNEVGDSLMVVQQGTVQVFVIDDSDETHLIDQSGPGDILGEMALLTSEPRTASVQAIDEVHVLRLSAQSFHKLVKEYPQLNAVLTQLVATRLEKSGRDALTEKVLQGHRIVRQIGRGGMGIVYEAEDLSHNRRVALKMMSHRLVHSSHARARFQQEADLIQSLNHPNIVRSHNRFSAFYTCFIAMEFCEGRTLQDLIISESPLPEVLCRRIIGGVAAAISYLHSNDVIHLDLKPSNVMANENGTTKLMDFGLAEFVSEIPRLAGNVSGTVRYMSPEQRVGAVQNFRSDYFSLGCVAWEMFSGKPLFSDSAAAELMRDFSKWNPPDWSEAREGLSEDICIALAPSLVVDPADRELDIEQMASWSTRS